MSAPATLYDVLSVLEPPPALTVSQWADAHRRLPIGASAEPGPWRTAREPFQRGIMDAAHEGADTIVLMKSAQVGATECLLNLIGYFLAHDPAPILLIEPTEGLVKRIAKRRLWPMLSATPAITVRIAPRQGRRASSALLQVLFPGGSLTLVGANSATPLASDPIRIVLADEIDKYPATLGDEGDPLALGLARTKRFWNRLHVLTSTPTRMGASRIEREYLASDQRRYFVPCPRCGEPFVLAWRHVHWTGGRTGDPATAHWICPACGGRIEDAERPGMIARGAWRATAPFRGVIGFHVWEAYSSTATLRRIVDGFLRAHRGGVAALREWQNQTLGEPWEEDAERADPLALLSRREPYTAETLPPQVILAVAGVDTQDDRLEMTSLAVGVGQETWIAEHRIFRGDPARPEVWRELDDHLRLPLRDTDGRHRHLVAVAIDSAGHKTDFVYAFAAPRGALTYECPSCGVCRTRVLATIGRAGWDRRIIDPDPSKLEIDRAGRTVLLYTVGVDQAKAMWVANLSIRERGPGYVHLPTSVDEEYVDQLTGEELATRFERGLARREWRARRPRVEALDCAVLALAALRLLDPRLEALAERLRQPPPAPMSAPAAASAVAAPHPVAPRRRFVPSPYLGGVR